MIDIPKSPDLQSQQIQEMAQSAPDPFLPFGGGVWARDYSRVSKQTSCPTLLDAYPGETMAEEHHDPIESRRTNTGELQQPTKPEGMIVENNNTIATLVQLPTSN